MILGVSSSKEGSIQKQEVQVKTIFFLGVGVWHKQRFLCPSNYAFQCPGVAQAGVSVLQCP